MRPILVIDWKKDFIRSLKDVLVQGMGKDFTNTLVVFPHQRPRRYLGISLLSDPALAKPLIPPEMVPVNEWVGRLRQDLSEKSLRTASPLDQAGLLHTVVESLRQKGAGLLSNLPLEREQFFPWGMLLASLLEELSRQNKKPVNLTSLSGEVQDTAAALLEQLKLIYERYVHALDERGWTTPGLNARWSAQNLDKIADKLSNTRILIAGFYALTGTQDALFRKLWQQGRAEILIHGDPALAESPGSGKDAKVHWACGEHEKWIKRWHAKAALTQGTEKEAAHDPEIRFFEGFDLHSQLKALEREMAGNAAFTNTAVVIPDTGTLMPVLHHLPVKDVNVSMGYPLARSTLLQLIETMLRLQETSEVSATGKPRYYWRELINLIRHPYLKMLDTDGKTPMRGLLRAFEKHIRGHEKFLDPFTFEPDLDAFPEDAFPEDTDRERARQGLENLLTTCLTNLERVGTLAELAKALHGLCAMLIPKDAPEGTENPWHVFPIDAECLYRLIQNIIPQLEDCSISGEEYPRDVLFAILRQLIDLERVPFEAEPITGLQVLGMLETRLLRFQEVFLLDATEDKIPGAPRYDPLLPDSLRFSLGLPNDRDRGLVSAYNFYRLISGAGQVKVFYQTGVTGTGLLGQKSMRSRFVEQLVWEEEKKQGKILYPGDPPVAAIHVPLRGIPKKIQSIPKTEVIQEKLVQLLEKPISASRLDAYLLCPVRFFFERLTLLKPVEEVNETGDPAELGTLVHGVLKDFLAPHKGKLLDMAELPAKELQDLFLGSLRESVFYRQMAYDMRLGVTRAGRERLRRFLENQKPTTILELEKNYEREITLEHKKYLIQGRLDRVDERDGEHLILDYKTGLVTVPSKKFWEDTDLWERMENQGKDKDPELLGAVATRLSSVQLPVYLFLYCQSPDMLASDAAQVELRDKGEEKWLFGPKFELEAREAVITEKTPLLLRFLIQHMLDSNAFHPRPGKHCDWCPFGFACASG